ncbi:MAG TPA: thioredoxin [Candidatus Polarisedimenticolia bacterium]|nr:thioredoxin [Candidatus Polarisedimenticolia bacterium]
MGAVVEVDDRNFDREVLESGIPVLLDFSAVWCGPCKRLEPIVEALAAEYGGRLKVAHIDIDNSQAIAVRFGIMSVPTVLFFKEGKVRDQVMGYVPKDRLVEKIDLIL